MQCYRHAFRFIPATFIALCLFLSRSVQAQIYVATFAQDFGTLDLATGNFLKLGKTDVVVTALTFAPNGTLYAEGLDDRLYTINPADGTTTVISSPQGTPGGFLVGLAASSNSALLGYDWLNPAPFYSIPTDGSAVTQLGDSGQALDYYGSGTLVYGPGGTLYADADTAETGDNEFALFSVNPTNGLWTRIGTNLGSSDVLSLFYDGTTLYGAEGSGLTPTPKIYSIDTNTGLATFTGVSMNSLQVGVPDSFDAAAVRIAAVPEPGQCALLISLLFPVVALFARYRRTCRG